MPNSKTSALPIQIQGAIFYAMAMSFAMLVALLAPLIGHFAFPLTMLTPAFSVAIMMIACTHKPKWLDFIRGVGLTRLGSKAWPTAVTVPTILMAIGLFVLWAIGLTEIQWPEGGQSLLLAIPQSIAIGIVFAVGEEIGWRGYLLPRMMVLGPVTAMLSVGFLQGLWHLPLMLATNLYHPDSDPRIVVPLFLTTLTLAGIAFGSLRLLTGSIWPVALAHGAVNVGWEMTSGMTTTKTLLTTEYLGGESGLIMIAGLAALSMAVVLKRDQLPLEA